MSSVRLMSSVLRKSCQHTSKLSSRSLGTSSAKLKTFEPDYLDVSQTFEIAQIKVRIYVISNFLISASYTQTRFISINERANQRLRFSRFGKLPKLHSQFS